MESKDPRGGHAKLAREHIAHGRPADRRIAIIVERFPQLFAHLPPRAQKARRRSRQRGTGSHSAQHQVSVVAQLLVLLDGIEERGQIFVLATTNRPEQVDLALRSPGRFDQVVWMGLPDDRGRADIFEHYLRGLKLDPRLTPHRLAAELASAAQGMTGADIAYVCQRAALFCVKEAASGSHDGSDIRPSSPCSGSFRV